MHNVRELHNWRKFGKTLVNYACFSDPESEVLRIFDDGNSTEESILFCRGIPPAISLLHVQISSDEVNTRTDEKRYK